MPCVSQFYGVSIYLYFNDHDPPHFHARYGEHEGVFAIEPFRELEGHLPRRAKQLVEEWAKQHRDELLNDWNLARAGQPVQRIAPLP